MPDQYLTIAPLTFVDEHDGVLVGRPDRDSYAVLPADGAALLRRLQAGDSIEQAEEWYRATYGEDLDMEGFVESLDDLGFLSGEPATTAGHSTVFQQRLGAAILSRFSLIIGAAVVLVWLVVIIDQPDLAPHPSQVFFINSILAAQVMMVVGQIPLLGLHESFHVLAGWRAGLPSRLGISSRMFFIVFETHLNGLLSLPRRRRYLPFLAGIYFDLVFIAACGLTAALSRGPDGSISWFGRLALAVAFPVLMRMAWQGLLFLRTDLYYLIAAVLGCHDLDGAARIKGRNLWRLLRGLPRLDESDWSDRDRAVARWYAPAAGLGAVVLTISTGLVIKQLIEAAWRIFAAGFGAGLRDPHFWDVTISLAICVGQLLLLLVLRIRAFTSARTSALTEDPQ